MSTIVVSKPSFMLNNSMALNSNGSLSWLYTTHWIMEYSAETIAILTNTILVYLILTETNKDYRAYRRVLLLNCIVDYLCTFVGIFLQAHFEIIDGQWIYILSEPLIYFPRNIQLIICGCYGWSNSFGITTMPIQFYFRKKLICDDEKLSVKDLLKFTGISFTSSCACAFVFYLCFYVSQGVEFSAQILIEKGLVRHNNVSNLINGEMTSWPMILIIIMASVSDITALILILHFSFQIYRKLSILHRDMHPKTRLMQANMNRMLAVQTLSTFSVGVIPMLLLLIIMITRVNIVGAGSIISILLAFVPVVNPVCTLVLVSQFRRRFLSIIKISPITSNYVTGHDTTKDLSNEKPVFTLPTML